MISPPTRCCLVATAVIGFAGFWLIGDEVHISTIAVHPDWRGRGLGELLLLNLLHVAAQKPATMVTLEVRTSNIGAQRMYEKYQFDHVGRRRRYYKDTGEDALIMTIPALTASYSQFLANMKTHLFQRLQNTPS
jgi:ribosomal-protein-alanine N-acetyltransferase